MTPNMPNIRAWVAALRSGEFRQGVGALIQFDEQDQHTFCCLGVACDLALKDGVELEVDKQTGMYLFAYGNSGSLPQEVQRWLGVDHENPMLLLHESSYKTYGRHSAPAITCNDDYKLSFSEIADAIERTFLKEEPHGNGNIATE